MRGWATGFKTPGGPTGNLGEAYRQTELLSQELIAGQRLKSRGMTFYWLSRAPSVRQPLTGSIRSLPLVQAQVEPGNHSQQ